MTISILKATLRDLQSGRALARSNRAWLVDGFERFLRDGQLEKDLGLSIPGGHYFQPHVVARFAERNALLKRLAAAQPGGNTWQVAKRLESIIKQYPDNRSELLDRLFSCGVKVPGSAKQLQRILTGENAVDRTL